MFAKTRPLSYSIVVASVLLAGIIAANVAHAKAASPFVAPKDKALVAFVRSGKAGKKNSFFIIYNDKRECVAMFEKEDIELIPLKPGKHSLYMSSNNVQRIDFDVEAGRTYFVRFEMQRGIGVGILKFDLAKRGSDEFGEVQKWVEGKKTADATKDVCHGHVIEDDKKGRNQAQKKLERANEKWDQRDEEYMKKWTLTKKDGLTAKEAGKL